MGELFYQPKMQVLMQQSRATLTSAAMGLCHCSIHGPHLLRSDIAETHDGLQMLIT